MFSGIVEEIGRVKDIATRERIIHLEISATKVLQGTKIGDSIAVNGTCLTVTNFTSESFSVDLAPETLRRTNLEELTAQKKVNLERSLAVGERIGGHFVQGHIDARANVCKIQPEGEAILISFSIPSELTRYVVNKGYIAIDGMSLTVVEIKENVFSISFIPHTLENSIAKDYKLGTSVNLEADILGKYVERILLRQPDNTSNITKEFLDNYGFLT